MGESDRISELPDDVLCHILSLVPTREVVSTMLLSKRWQKLWLHVPILDVDLSHTYSVRFINAFLMASRSQRIKRFRLKCCDHSDWVPIRHFKEWVNTAVNDGVEHLQMDLDIIPRFRLIECPGCVLNCTTLVVLKLGYVRIDTFSFAQLPSLKTLHLNQTRFLQSWYLTKLLNDCPLLEDLKLHDLLFNMHSSGDLKLKIMLNLVRADVNIPNCRISLTALCNAKYLRSELSTPISVFPNLTHLEIILGYNSTCTWYMVFKMLNCCPKLQNLVFDKDVNFQSFLDEVKPYLPFVPECISSQLRTCSFTNYTGAGSEILFARYILKNSNFLRRMAISP